MFTLNMFPVVVTTGHIHINVHPLRYHHLHVHKYTLYMFSTTLTCQQVLEGDTIRDAGALMLTVNRSHKGECQVEYVAVDKVTLGTK